MDMIKTAMLGMTILCVLSLAACNKNSSETQQEVPLVMVAKPIAQHSELKSYAGDIQARQQTALSFRVGGQVLERYVDVGDEVRIGQVLAKLDVKDAQLQLNSSRAQLENAQSATKTAYDELQRFKQLLPMNAVSQSQYDSVNNQYKNALSNLKQAQANYEVSQNQTRYNQLIANKNGVITERSIEVGQVVAAGQAAYQLAINGDREVVIGVPEQAISSIKVGQDAFITLWSKPNEQLKGYVREISPAADQSRTFAVKVALKNGTEEIQLGQSARVFFNERLDNALTVPLSSISANNNQAYVLVLKADHSVRKVTVKVGHYGKETATILSGLSPQDYVVIGGVHLLRDQQKIKPVDRENRMINLKAGA